MNLLVIFFVISFDICKCRDFYMGMFKTNDLLVAQDVLYKERLPYRAVIAKYGRIFKCPITYFRVVDRLGVSHGPRVEILRGGLQSKYIVLRLTSVYNYPISVNIYVGCENKIKTTKRPVPSQKTSHIVLDDKSDLEIHMETELVVEKGTTKIATTMQCSCKKDPEKITKGCGCKGR